MGIKGLDFVEAWEKRTVISFEGIRVNILGINETIKSKEKTKRPLDLVDIETLKSKLKLERKK